MTSSTTKKLTQAEKRENYFHSLEVKGLRKEIDKLKAERDTLREKVDRDYLGVIMPIAVNQ